ncbi:MAG: small multi-drug export protein [Methanoregula sp.]|jgi:uncharacterized membrane protein|nr:small multi-drug export protein [Methanoregula sp.]
MPDLQQVSLPELFIRTAVSISCLVVIPLTFADVAGVPLAPMLSFIGAILIFQPFAGPIGLVLGIPPWVILTAMASVGLGAVIGIWAICDVFAKSWHRLDVLIRKVHERTHQSAGFQKYGMLMFFLFIWVPGIGLYGCALLAWLFEWRNAQHILVLMAGWMIAAVIVLAASMGVFLALSL